VLPLVIGIAVSQVVHGQEKHLFPRQYKPVLLLVLLLIQIHKVDVMEPPPQQMRLHVLHNNLGLSIALSHLDLRQPILLAVQKVVGVVLVIY
jgi:hypothetical protein